MKKTMLALLLIVCLGVPRPGHGAGGDSPVTGGHLLMIESLFSKNGLKEASVKLDRNGKVLLGGRYNDTGAVNLAFSLVQSVVGVKYTSPVTPENVKVREWARQLAGFFPTTPAAPPSSEESGASPGGTRKYALVVGIKKFKNDKSGKNALKYADQDAQNVSTYLQRELHYDAKDIALLLNEKASTANIQAAMDKISAKAGIDDEVFLYFSSHGAPIYDGSLNIVTYDTLFKDHFTMSNSALASKSIRSFLDKTRARKVVVVLDVCYSGAAFKNIDGFYYAGSKSISFDDDNQGFSRAAMAQTLLGAKDITLENEAHPSANSGGGSRIIISASDAGEKSWESDSIRGSFFTHHFLKELHKRHDLKEAFQLARPQVTSDVKREKHADQNPQVVATQKDW